MSVIGKRIAILVAVSMACVLIAGDSQAAKKSGHLQPVQSKKNGLSYGEWSARWWQWCFSLPTTAHPLFDTADCSAGQTGDVWFLGGTFFATEVPPASGNFLGVADRICTIPSGTSLFFPIVNAEAATIEGNGATEAELRAVANFFADTIDLDSLQCTIDGNPVSNLADYRVESPLYTYGPLPDDNILEPFLGEEATVGFSSLSVSDGVYLMIPPLSVGEHTIEFSGQFVFENDPEDPEDDTTFGQQIKYTITVTP